MRVGFFFEHSIFLLILFQHFIYFSTFLLSQCDNFHHKLFKQEALVKNGIKQQKQKTNKNPKPKRNPITAVFYKTNTFTNYIQTKTHKTFLRYVSSVFFCSWLFPPLCKWQSCHPAVCQSVMQDPGGSLSFTLRSPQIDDSKVFKYQIVMASLMPVVQNLRQSCLSTS